MAGGVSEMGAILEVDLAVSLGVESTLGMSVVTYVISGRVISGIGVGGIVSVMVAILKVS